MSALEIIFFIIFAFTAPLLGYQFLLGVLALYARKNTSFESCRNRKFAFVVPAHNEEKIIAKTIYSLSGLIYPKKLYEVFVVADNCSDNTAELARSLGVRVLERTNTSKKGKGYALRWAFDRILKSKENYDAIIVVDADSLISGNYLEVMNYYLEQGKRVIQSSDLVLPAANNWSIQSTSIGFLLYNYVKPLGRKVLNFNMGLRGNGMCFESDVLREVPWQAWSLIEDVEYGLVLILNGIKINFAPEAIVWAQMPVKAENAETQRSRWEMGRFRIMKKYTLKFLFESFRRRSLSCFDVFIDLVTPPFVNLMFLSAIATLITSLLWLLGLLSLVHIILWIMILIVGVVYLFIGLYAGEAEKDLYKSLLHLPRYIFWKLKVYLRSLKKGKDMDWIKTKRDSS